MSNFDHRIPDDMAAEVLAKAARLYTETSKGYSLEDLQQAGLEAGIPPAIIREAVRNIEERRYCEQTKRKQLKKSLEKHIYQGILIAISLLIAVALLSGFSVALPLLIPAILLISIFVFKLESAISELRSHVNTEPQRRNASSQTLTVKVGKLEYFTDSKGLFIAVNDINYDGVQGIIGADGYETLGITGCKVGDVYEYKGVHNYRIQIIAVSDRNQNSTVTFEIDQQGEQLHSQIQELQQEVQGLQEQLKQLYKQLKDNQIEQNLIKQQLQQKNQEFKQLEQENSSLRIRNSQASHTFDSIIQEPGVLLREDFRSAIAFKTMQQVIEAVGRPNSSNENSYGVYWRYEKKVKDAASGNIGSAEVKFQNGVVTDVTFSSY